MIDSIVNACIQLLATTLKRNINKHPPFLICLSNLVLNFINLEIMEQDDLSRMRQQRPAQAPSKGPGAMPAGARQQAGDDKQKREEQEAEMRNNILSTVLTQEARARLATIAVARPERARLVENIIIQNTRTGGIRGKVDEDSLKGLLDKVNSQTKRETKVSYERRRVFDDDSDEDE